MTPWSRRASCSAALVASLLQHGEARLRDLHILRVVPAADTDAANALVVRGDGVAAPEDDQPVDAAGRSRRQGRVILDDGVPLVGGHAEADGGVGLVLGNLHAEQGGAVHAAER